MLFESQFLELYNRLPHRRVHRAKQQMRELLVQKRRMLSAEERTEQSEKILQQLEQMPSFQKAKTVLLYYPMNNEVDVLPLFKKYKHDKMLLLPVSHRRDMTVSPYEPHPTKERLT